MTEDWRIDNAKQLKGLTLHFKTYSRWSETWDHDHCAGCWAKFAEFDGPGIQQQGYATGPDCQHGAEYDWICEECFRDLKDVMGWKVA